MTERRDSRLPQKTIQMLKKAGFVGRATKPTQAIIQCAVCPLATDEKFYAYRAIKCTSLPSGTVSPIVRRLTERKFFVGKSKANVDSSTAQRPSRVFYRISAKARKILHGTEPLPDCRFRDRQQAVSKGSDSLAASKGSASLAELRRAVGTSQTALAESLGISQSGVSSLETRDVDRMTVGRLAGYAEALGGTLRLIVDFGKQQQVEVTRKKLTIRRNN
jgi:DNA-binding Xre family transcriptional regulator